MKNILESILLGLILYIIVPVIVLILSSLVILISILIIIISIPITLGIIIVLPAFIAWNEYDEKKIKKQHEKILSNTSNNNNKL